MSQNSEDTPDVVDKIDYLLRDWVSVYFSQLFGTNPTIALSIFVNEMTDQGIWNSEASITQFFRLSTQLCVEDSYKNIANAASNTPMVIRAKCYHTLDPFIRLIALLVKHSGNPIGLVKKVFDIFTGCLLQDHEQLNVNFQPLPYHRMFIMLFWELFSPDPDLEVINFETLGVYCQKLHILRPSKVPGFCYAWLELISHRAFIGRILVITPQQKGWNMYALLIFDLFEYLAPFLRNGDLTQSITTLYQGTLRVLLVLVHDFPNFLCNYHYDFCDVIPLNCIQMRNLILSAYPKNMRIPSPFMPNLKVEILPELYCSPRILTNFGALITPPQFKTDLDSYLSTREPVTLLSELQSILKISDEPGMRYNISLMNALVMYVGTQAIAYIHSNSLHLRTSVIASTAHMDIFRNLIVNLDTEGRYLFLNAVANQLRYPNTHTQYFSCTILYLFANTNTEAIQEQITRVLLERFIAHRPHPWGLLIVFLELMKNPYYKFWDHEFVHHAHIEEFFISAARSYRE